MNPKTGREPRSWRSNPRSFPWFSWRRSVMGDSYVIQEFLCMHVIDGQQRPGAKIVEESREPKSADRDRNQQVYEIPPLPCRHLMKIRLDIPEQIDEAHKQQPHRQPDQRSRITLKRTREQQQEGNREVENHQRKAHNLPTHG